MHKELECEASCVGLLCRRAQSSWALQEEERRLQGAGCLQKDSRKVPADNGEKEKRCSKSPGLIRR